MEQNGVIPFGKKEAYHYDIGIKNRTRKKSKANAASFKTIDGQVSSQSGQP
jgi:hypothetical protein